MTKLFVKRLTNLDFSFLDPKRGLVGESWLIDIELSGKLNEQGMVLDFGIVKSLVRNYIDEHIDHCLVIPTGYEGCCITTNGEEVDVTFTLEDGNEIIHKSIGSAIAKIPADIITVATVKEFLLQQLQKLLPDNVQDLEIHLYIEPGIEQSYQYSHGLRKHEGNCQRIAHGHRSQLQIFIDGLANSQWESHWFEAWRDIYIGTSRHLANSPSSDESYYEFKYQAPQGEFYLKLPKSRCYLMDDESTVENIAQHLMEQIAEKEPGKAVKVIAYEGIGKGSIAEITD